jgi:hypothetical protein
VPLRLLFYLVRITNDIGGKRKAISDLNSTTGRLALAPLCTQDGLEEIWEKALPLVHRFLIFPGSDSTGSRTVSERFAFELLYW